MARKIILVIFFIAATSGFAFWEWTPQTGRWINPKYAVKDTPKEQFEWAEGFRKQGEIEKAIREHKKLLKHYSDSDYASSSCYVLGEIYQEAGDYKESFDYYQKIVDDYPQSPMVLEAVKKQSVIAEKELKREPFWFFGPKKEKGDMLATVIENHPYADDSHENAFKLGLFYLEINEYGKAEETFTMMAERYTDPLVVEIARFYLIKTGFLSIHQVSTDPGIYNELKAKIDSFISLYPDSRYKNEVIEIQNFLVTEEAKKYFEIASYYERAGKKSSAQYYYKIIYDRYPETDYGKISAGKINTSD
jgi:outer membrane protein assembly factor BamD (BamD/ComL family)